MDKTYDFAGWATRNNVRCADGRTIMQNAFKENDGQKVPLVWNHRHDDPYTVLGHALLENRDEGVYAYCKFNNTESGQNAKELVQHGDITSLSIYANRLQQNGGNVVHGVIREVSLVLAGANPKAVIANVIQHGEELNDEAQIYFDEPLVLEHADEDMKEKTMVEGKKEEEKTMENEKKTSENEETIADVIATFNEKQKKVFYALIGQVLSEKENNNESEEDNFVKHNVFDRDDENQENVISHADLQEVLKDAKRCGSLRDSAIQHGMEDLQYLAHADYGVDPVDYLYPDARNVTATPQMIQRDTAWVGKVMQGVHHTPFSRVKSLFANITGDEARARGYVKGNRKLEEVITLLKRTTTPTTVYKKQKMDRDDIIDITDFDVVAWLKGEMRGMLEEEIARAILVGDGRSPSSDDKINEMNIRPIWTDDDLYTIKAAVTPAQNATAEDTAKLMIKQIIKARKDYKGSGNPTLFTTEDMLTDMLLIQDTTGRDIYDTEEKLRTKLRVKEIVTVPVMEGLTRTDGQSKTRKLAGIIVNLADYNVGADKGGAINMFDDFDIDYNQEKYLIETRCSGAMIKPYSAIAVEVVESAG
nr:MAG TPA: major capsid protein [Caudoviricetes sp.]